MTYFRSKDPIFLSYENNIKYLTINISMKLFFKPSKIKCAMFDMLSFVSLCTGRGGNKYDICGFVVM